MLDWTASRTALKWLCRLENLRAKLRRRGRRADPEAQGRAAFYAGLWREAAAAVGGAFIQRGYGVYEIRLGDLRTRVTDICCPLHDQMALIVAGNKPLTYRLLDDAGLPTPRRVVFTIRDFEKAARFLQETDRPCVVKPAVGTAGGDGVVTGVRRRSDLAWAAAAAAVEHGPELLIEEQKAGGNYRLLYLDGELLDAVWRRPPTVVGDGQSAIRRLVEKANTERLAACRARVFKLLTIDLDMRNTLAAQGLTLNSIPTAGATVVLKTVVNQNFGPENVTATSTLCDAVIEAGARAAACVGARFAGVDLVTPDPALPLDQAGGVILEVNVAPGLHYHYHKQDGDYPVAVRVLERLLSGQPVPEAPCLAGTRP
ncbi:MAG TPA: hypothetical protein VMS17_12760 [Gemmataceae bacterium]|nr:hypothetical protein [Gemmataceae bacterium]